MNSKLEEARKLSDEKGLPFEYVRQMLEFAERVADSAETSNELPKSRPIPEATALLWHQ